MKISGNTNTDKIISPKYENKFFIKVKYVNLVILSEIAKAFKISVLLFVTAINKIGYINKDSIIAKAEHI